MEREGGDTSEGQPKQHFIQKTICFVICNMFGRWEGVDLHDLEDIVELNG